jgi:hypothetical protein
MKIAPGYLVFAGTFLFAVLSPILIPRDLLRVAFCSAGFYFVITAFGIWLLLAGRFAGKHLRRLQRTDFLAAAASLAILVTMFAVAPPRFKVFDDEPALINVSRNIFYHKTASLSSVYLPGGSADSSLLPDKRPLLFPVLTCIIHYLRGYSSANGFIVNFICGILALFAFYLFLSRFFSRTLSLAGMLLMAGQPLFFFWITSSGMETLNLLFLIISFILLQRFILTKEAAVFDFLLMTLVLLAQCRYESLLFLALPLLLIRTIPRQLILRPTPIVCSLPLFLVPVLWQRKIFSAGSELTGVLIGPNSLQIPSDRAAFALKNFFSNFRTPDFGLGSIPCDD